MLKKFSTDQKGVAAIEFAILLPFLLILLYGAYQVSHYVSTVRKVDNVTNDIAYILSREGQIATASGGSLSGGRARLEAVFRNTIPFLMFPVKYDPESANFGDTAQIEVKYVGLPKFISTCPNDGIDRTTLRVMWQHKYPASVTNPDSTVDNNPGVATICDNALCPKSCGGTGGNYKSTYSDNFGTRANIIYPGQSFILINFAHDFESVMGDDFPGVGFVLPHKLEKVSSYAVRSKYTDLNNNGIVESNEVFNNMHICTDCTSPSRYPSGLTAGGNALRQICEPATAQTGNRSNYGACEFF